MSALRDFIAALDERGLLKRVDAEVDWKHELGDISRRSDKPLLFENIKDYPNRKIFSNGLSDYSTIALAIGIFDKDVRFRHLVDVVRRSFNMPIDPELVTESSFMDNCYTEDINLNALPVPWWSELDAGRYIGTWHLNVSCDPDTGTRNIGVYRMQVLTPNQTTVSVSPNSHLAHQIVKAEKKDEPLPMAVALGVDERLVISAASAPAYGIDEYSLAGGLIGKPVKLIPCVSQKLDVPADSEIVLEGIIKPGIRVQDGPFLDYAGIPNTNPNAHLFEVTAILFRDDYIFRGTAVGRPGAEDHKLYAILACLGLADFHGSRIRHMLQKSLLRKRAFKLFQLTGRVGKLAKKNKSLISSQ